MNSGIVVNSVRFIVLILAQVIVFDQLHFAGYINPLPYILFIIALPFNLNKSLTLVLGFVLGLTHGYF